VLTKYPAGPYPPGGVLPSKIQHIEGGSDHKAEYGESVVGEVRFHSGAILWQGRDMVRLDISLHVLDLRVSLPNLVHLDRQILVYPLDQYFESIPWSPYDVIHAPVRTVGLLPYLHVLILSCLIEDLGTLFIYGLRSAGLRRYD